MSIETELKKDGINVVEELDTLKINNIAKNVAKKLANTLNLDSINESDLFIKLSRLNMYTAFLPKGISAKYFYKNNSIYFSVNTKESSLCDVAVHECIHYIQSRFDEKNNLYRLGLCDFYNSKSFDLCLNEAAVQAIASKCISAPYEDEKYFGISIKTNSPSYYPLECAIINQMAYITGEGDLINSTINCTDDFKNKFISLTSEKVYNEISKNINTIVDKQEKLNCLFIDLERIEEHKNIDKIISRIDKEKAKIRNIFMNTQNLIITTHFDNYIKTVSNSKEIEAYRNKLYNFKNYIGITDNYSFFNDYYLSKMEQLENKYKLGDTTITAIALRKENFISVLFRKLRTLFKVQREYEHSYNANR